MYFNRKQGAAQYPPRHISALFFFRVDFQLRAVKEMETQEPDISPKRPLLLSAFDYYQAWEPPFLSLRAIEIYCIIKLESHRHI